MKKLSLALLLAGAAFAGVLVEAETLSFENAQLGELPSGWLAGNTGGGNPKWSIVTDNSAPTGPRVLKQSGEAKFCWCVDTNVSFYTGKISVKLKSISGKEDESGGLVWRWQDGDNYYVTRANALEDNVTVYYTTNGERHECGRALAKVTPNVWHTLSVDVQATRFTVYFDNVKMLEWQDDTINRAGGVGVWTKADSVTEFDDLSWETK